MKALISTYNRSGLAEFAQVLSATGFELVSTGGTGRALSNVGLPVQQVSDLTGFPELLDGRVKTLHPRIFAGILARRDDAAHASELANYGIDTIDLVVCNLYPFIETVSQPCATLDVALEHIDIGGPAMLRAAAKNFPYVLVIVDPGDYKWLGEQLYERGPQSFTLDERRELARKAFQHVALYDTSISRYLGGDSSVFSSEITLGFTKLGGLRYGENPHQKAALYSEALATGGIVNAIQLHGPRLSFNNILDADSAWGVVSDYSEPAVAVVKHTNPCGLAIHPDQSIAYTRAFEGDTLSAYGGIVGFNRAVTEATATAMRGVFYEIIVAPCYEPAALEILKKRRKARILQLLPSSGPLSKVDVRRVSGGALIQLSDDIEESPSSWKVVTDRRPTDAEMADLAFAWRAAKHIRSNTIVLASDGALVGMGAGQPNRLASVHLALRAAGDKASGSVLASDAFFPFADNIELASTGGITAMVQPGGSIRDEEVIAAASRFGIAMVLTGTRHFKH